MKPKIVILGAGFAGIQAARSLSRHGLHATVVDRNPYTTMLPVLPDVASGWVPAEFAAQSLAGVLPPQCRRHRATVESIDLEKSVLNTDQGRIDYDYLVMAHGSAAAGCGLESEQPIYKLDCLDDARSIQAALADFSRSRDRPNLVFIGGGYTGIELAICLAAKFRQAKINQARLILLERNPEILAFLPRSKRQYVEQAMLEHGIEWRCNSTIESCHEREVRLNSGERISCHLLFATTGARSAINQITGRLERHRDGRIKVNPYLQPESYDNLFVAGDAAAITGPGQVGTLRRAVNFAYYSGQRAGKNVWLSIAGRPLQPFNPLDAGWVIPLHDRALGKLFSKLYVQGRLPLRLHYFMCGFRHYGKRRQNYFYRLALNLAKLKQTRSTLDNSINRESDN